MRDDHRRLEPLNPEPDGGAGWSETEAGRRARARVEARLDPGAASLEALPRSRAKAVWLIAAPALVVLLAVGLPLLLLRGSEPADTSSAPLATTTTVTATTLAPATTLPVPPPVYQFVGTVLDKQGVGPQLCQNVAESLPPQCAGTPVAGLDWADVPWAETAGDTTWAVALLVGSFDGAQFTLTRTPEPAQDRPGPEPDFTSPCPEPAGGWAVTDPDLATQEAFDAAQAYASAQPGYAGLWIDQLRRPTGEAGFDPAAFVLNAKFTGDLEAHEAALRGLYGGPLCVTQAPRSEADLMAILADIHEVLTSPDALAAGIFAGQGAYGTDVTRSVVEASVFAVVGDGQSWVDARYGVGVVELHSMLVPVEGT